MDRWCTREEVERGTVEPVSTVHDLARLWYPGRHRPEWTPPSPAEVRDRFRRAGLTGPFWSVAG